MRTLLILVLACGLLRDARADQYVFNINTKQEQKRKNRWSLSEWLETRERMRLMDLWLVLHSPSPYEFYVAGAYKTGKSSRDAYYGGWDIQMAGYAYIFGLELQRQLSNNEPRWLGLFNFRAFGFHNQSTNFTLQGGLQHQSRGGAELWSPVLGASLTVYLRKAFGIAALYRHAFAPGRADLGNKGDRFEGGAFIDFKFVRVYGDYFNETEVGYADRSASGGQLGVRVYF